MRFKLFLFFAICMGSVAANGQERSQSDSVNALKNIIVKVNTVSGSAVGFTGAPSPAWCSFAYLVSIADDDQLLAMTKDSSPALRVYAYTALMHRKYRGIEAIKESLLKDKTPVQTLSGCLMNTSTVAAAIQEPRQWYSEQGINDFIEIIEKDGQYRNELFDSLINNKPVTRRPKKE